MSEPRMTKADIDKILSMSEQDVIDSYGLTLEQMRELLGGEIPEPEDDFSEPVDDGVSVSGLTVVNADALGYDAEPPRYLVNRILETDAIGILAGQSQAYKSFLALALAHSICTGNDFCGHRVFEPGKVLYICGEGQGALKRRIKALQIECGFFGNNILTITDSLRIDNDHDLMRIAIEVDRHRPALIIFDTFSSMNSQTNENDNSEVSSVLALIQRHLRNGFSTTLIVHHYGKDAERGIRGASAFGNNVDFVFSMARTGEKTDMKTVLSCQKMKDGEPFDDINLIAMPVSLGLTNQDGTACQSLVLKHDLSFFAGVDKHTQAEKFIIEYRRLLESDPRPTAVGIGVCKKKLYRNAESVVGISGQMFRNMVQKVKKNIGKENYIEINDIVVINQET